MKISWAIDLFLTVSTKILLLFSKLILILLKGNFDIIKRKREF